MNNIKWEFAEPLENESVLDDFEIDYAFRISDEFKKFITANNGAIPNKGLYDFPRKDMVLAGILSFNKNSEETVYMVLNSFVKNGKISMLPFATDGFGNLICLKENQIVFWNHESDIVEEVADTLENFIKMLHN